MVFNLVGRPRARSFVVLILTAALFLALAFTAMAKSGAKLSVSVKPPNPAASGSYTLTIKGKARKGHLGTHGNRSEIDRIEQAGGKCAATPQAELQKSGINDLGPKFVKAGKFKIKQKRIATASPGVTVRFCIYLSSGVHTLDAKATTSYTTK